MWKSREATGFASSLLSATNFFFMTMSSGSSGLGKFAAGCLLTALLTSPVAAQYKQNGMQGMGLQNGMTGFQNNGMNNNGIRPQTGLAATNPLADKTKQGQTATTGIKPLQGGTTNQPNNGLHPQTAGGTIQQTPKVTPSQPTAPVAAQMRREQTNTAQGKPDRIGKTEAKIEAARTEAIKTEAAKNEVANTKNSGIDAAKTGTAKTETAKTGLPNAGINQQAGVGVQTRPVKPSQPTPTAGVQQQIQTGTTALPGNGSDQQASVAAQTKVAVPSQPVEFQEQGQVSQKGNQLRNLSTTATVFNTIKMTEPTQPNTPSAQNSGTVSGLMQSSVQIQQIQNQMQKMMGLSLSASLSSQQTQVVPQQVSSQQVQNAGSPMQPSISQSSMLGSLQQQLQMTAAGQSSLQPQTQQQQQRLQNVNQVYWLNKAPLRLDTTLVQIPSATSVLFQGQTGKQSPMANVANQLPDNFVQQVVDKQQQQIQGQQQQIQGDQQQIQVQQQVIAARTNQVTVESNEVKAEKQEIADQQAQIAAQQAEIQKLQGQQKKSDTCVGPFCAGSGGVSVNVPAVCIGPACANVNVKLP